MSRRVHACAMNCRIIDTSTFYDMPSWICCHLSIISLHKTITLYFPGNGVRNCVHFCLWPLLPLERCREVFSATNHAMNSSLFCKARGALSNNATKRFYSVDQIALLSSFQFSLDVCAYLIFVKFVIADREYNSVL